MKIKIEKKLAPFSSLCGTSLIIPKTYFEVKIFPMKLEFRDKSNNKLEPKDILEIFLELKGPVKDFKIFQNIEKKCVEVFGFFQEGFIRYKIKVINNKLGLIFERLSITKIKGKVGDKKVSFEKQKPFILPIKISSYKNKFLENKFLENKFSEKLSLGIHKKQDVELIKRREDLKEILPIWFALGQLIPPIEEKYEGVAIFLKECEKLIQTKEKDKLEKCFLKIYKAGFRSIFSPRLIDDDYQGIIDITHIKNKNVSSLILLKKGYELIRSLFLQKEKDILKILPCLCRDFHSGRMLNLNVGEIGRMDIEWSKKLIKKIILYSKKDKEIKLQLQSSIKFFRIRKNKKEKGLFYKSKDLIKIKSDRTYYFDRFQK